MPTDYPPLNNAPLTKEGFWTVPWVMYFASLFGGGSGGGNAPANAEYLIGVANGDLPDARVVTNSNSNVWNLAVAGQASVSRAALSGDITAAFDGNVTTLSTTGVTAGTYGDSTHVGRFTVDAKGRLSAASNVAIAATGDVVGPGSATDNAITRFDGTTGKLIQNSGITIADGATGTLSGTNTGDQNLFLNVAVSGQSTIVADSTTDTLTIAAGSNIVLTTDATTDTLTITSTASGGGTVIGVDRLLGDGSTTTFFLPDVAEYVTAISDAGLIVDPTLFSLASTRDSVVFATAPTAGHVLTFQYVEATL
jgi:hypothetical protein